MDQFSEPERLRRQAEEYRAMAELLSHEEPRATYLRLAQAYDMMADNTERVTRHLENSK